MAVQTYTHIRGGKEYKEIIGTDENGQSVHYIEDPDIDPETGQPIEWWPKQTIIDRIYRGGVAGIRTEWARSVIAENGTPIPKLETTRPQPTNEADKLYFIAGMGMPIMRSEGNIFARRHLGFNNLPFWNTATGAVNVLTPEQEVEPPTNDYDE